MERLLLILGTLLISVSSVAGTSLDMNSAITKGIQSTQGKSSQNKPTIVYGGQDISRQIIADADQTTFSIQSTLIS